MIQIPLNIQFTTNATLDNFVEGSNQEIVSAVRQCARGGSTRTILVYGAPGTGKSHLMQAAAQEASDSGRSVCYLPFTQYPRLEPSVLDGLESRELVIVDDIDRIAGNTQWQVAVFEFYNRLEDRGGQLLFSTQLKIADTRYTLADLSSRLSAAPTYLLRALSDGERKLVIQQRANELGFEMSSEVCEYLFRRIPRDMHTLCELLGRIEQLSLVQKRKVTIPLVRQLIDNP